MVAKAETKYLRISPKKLRQVIFLVKNRQALEAQFILKAVNKKGAGLLGKTLTSAIANAKNKGYKEDKLFISKLLANSGPVLKRWRAASFGRATVIRKRTSHILIELDTSEKIIGKVKIKG
ncbi:MAG: 50S ribosomal protein L22 [Candidatus Omnitrophica bacterium]|nr:50S ribosomal protein L22 [Candidatus Omnitrophota bacterium]